MRYQDQIVGAVISPVVPYCDIAYWVGLGLELPV